MSTTLSPRRADIGKKYGSASSRSVANSWYLPRMSPKAPSDQPTRSILLTATTTSRIPSRLTIKLCRRVCSTTPCRASTRTTASWQVDAPVTMFRVYCS